MTTDLIIIGGGTAGLGAAREAVAAGASPLLITDGPIGGDCTFTGCVPSKSLIADSHRGTPFPEAMERLHRVVAEDVTVSDLTIPDSYCNPKNDSGGHKCPKGFKCMKLSPLGKAVTGFTGEE